MIVSYDIFTDNEADLCDRGMDMCQIVYLSFHVLHCSLFYTPKNLNNRNHCQDN